MSACNDKNPNHKPYSVMTAVEQIDDGSGKYTKKIELSDERIIEIFNWLEWSEDTVLNGGYDFKFIIDGREVLYNSNNGSADNTNSNTSTPTQSSTPEQPSAPSNGQVLYWTPNGKSYHTTKSCPTLSRSKTILEGTLQQSGKSDPCDRCH